MNNENKVEEVVVVPSVEVIPTLMEEKLKKAIKEAQVVIESKKEINMEENKININETGRKIGQNIAVGLILAEKTVKTLIEKGKTKTKSTVEQGKSFIGELVAGYKEIKSIALNKDQVEAIKKAVEEHKLDIENN